MTKERLEELLRSVTDVGDVIVPLEFARVLLLECAKTVCINCKDGSPSLATNDPNHRIHQLTPKWPEACRAPSFFIEGE